MSSAVRAIASCTIAFTTTAVLSLGSVALGAASSIDELSELNLRAWNSEPELLDQVYAPDGVHTATYYDFTTEFPGPDRIALLAGHGNIELIGPRIEIPAADGEWRWASFVSLGGGTACLFHAVDGMITRHDCVLPKNSYEGRASVGLADAETSAAIDVVMARLDGKWGPDATVEGLAESYAPDAVHSARFFNRTTRHVGPEEIITVARSGIPIEVIGPRVDFEAPEGELAWAQVNSLSGGSVCLFHAVDGMITRHDCFVPTSV